MRLFYLVLLFLLLAPGFLRAQAISINTDASNPDPSAILDVKSSNKGMLVPRMTTAQRTAIAAPATGLLVFDTTTGGFWFYNGAAWTSISAPKTLQDADGNTKVQVEKNPNEDIVRFDLAGAEKMVLRRNPGGSPLLEFPNGSSNTLIGVNAGTNTTSGSQNTGIGAGVFFNNSTGFSNTAIGTSAMNGNIGGSQNTAVGGFALLANTNATENTAVGSGSVTGTTTGNANTGVGVGALVTNTTGARNTALGKGADVTVNNLTNATAIGYNAKVGASNSLVLGGTGADAVKVGIGTASPGKPLHVVAEAYGISHSFGGAELATYVDGNAGWIGTTTDHPLLFYTFDAPTPQMAITQDGKVGIGTGAPNGSALLEMQSTDRGMLVPRMTSAQRTAIAAPATGLLVYDTNTNAFWFYNGTAWTTIGGGVSTLIADADNNTKVQVEKNPNEDIVRFDLGGTESMILQKNAGGLPRLELPNALESTFVGQGAGANMTTGTWNTAIGFGALTSSTDGAFNTATGWKALYSNTNGFMNSAFGIETLYSNTSGNWNTAIGRLSLFSNTIGSSNTSTGDEALKSNINGSYNTAVGRFALKSNTNVSENTAVGYNALANTTTGPLNTAVGSNALKGNTTGESNAAFGKAALENNTTGNFNVAIGRDAMFFNTTGSNNTACGFYALRDNNGGNNTGFGRSSLSSNSTGTNNTGLGGFTNVSAGNLTNATVIGANASVNASNKVRIGDAAVTVIEGQVAYTFPSDARFKFNIHDETVPGLAFIEKLRPVTYQFDTRKFDEHLMQNMPDSIRQRRLAGQDYRESTAIVQTGFLAQEVEKACQELNFTFSGLHVPTSAVDNYGIAYGSFVPLLVKAVQEQQAVIELGKLEIEKLKAENVAMKAENAAMKAQLDAQAAQLKQITAALQTAGIGVGN